MAHLRSTNSRNQPFNPTAVDNRPRRAFADLTNTQNNNRAGLKPTETALRNADRIDMKQNMKPQKPAVEKAVQSRITMSIDSDDQYPDIEHLPPPCDPPTEQLSMDDVTELLQMVSGYTKVARKSPVLDPSVKARNIELESLRIVDQMFPIGGELPPLDVDIPDVIF